MNFIARDTDYAIRALLFIAIGAKKNPKTKTTVDEIVKKLRLPERFLRRILQKLAKNKILSSYKGKDGGFSFLKSPEDVSLADIIDIFQGKLDITNCLLKGKACPNIKICVLRRKIKNVGQSVNIEFKKITIASLLKEAQHGKKKNRSY